MATFTEHDLRYSYQWSAETLQNLPAKIHFKDNLELNLEDGHEILLFINGYMKLKNLGMKCTFEKIEHILKKELPEKTRSLNKVKRFLSENYFF